MKKILGIIVLLIVALTLLACKQNEEQKVLVDSPIDEKDNRNNSVADNGTYIIDNSNKEMKYRQTYINKAKTENEAYGDSFLVSNKNEDFYACWQPILIDSGYYKAYLLWPNVPNASTKVNVKVTYQNGENTDETRYINQSQNTGVWVYIGTYYMSQGTTSKIEIYGVDGELIVADSARFELSYLQNDIQREEKRVLKDAEYASPSETLIVINKEGAFELRVDGAPYYAKGVCDVQAIEQMALAGINTVRTYSTAVLDEGLLDKAHSLGIKVVVGLWLHHESGSFNYSETDKVRAYYEDIIAQIDRYKNHPAILAWAVGNEVDKSTSPNLPHIYKAMNDIAKYIHEVDPYRPTMAVLAGSSTIKIASIRQLAPHIDIMGINSYKSIVNVIGNIRNWKGPYMIGEYATDQPVETKTATSWGAVFELNNEEKAKLYYDRYMNHNIAHTDTKNVGSFAFKDTGSFRVTHTWYQLILNGKYTRQYYYMKSAWTNEPLEETIYIEDVTINDKVQQESVYLDGVQTHTIKVNLVNPDSRPIDYEFEIRREAGIETNTIPQPFRDIDYIPTTDPNVFNVNINIPGGMYRLYVYATDDLGNISSFTFPFMLEGEGFIVEEQEGVQIITPSSGTQFKTSGLWQPSTNMLYQGILTHFTREQGAKAVFNPIISENGKYAVYYYNLYQSAHDDKIYQIIITYANGQTETIEMDNSILQEGWNHIGDFEFDKDQVSYVTIIKTESGTKTVRATAIAFIPKKDK